MRRAAARRAILLAASIAGLLGGCATTTGGRSAYLARTDEIVARLGALGQELTPFAETLRLAETSYLDGLDLDSRRRDPGAARQSLASSASAVRDARARLAEIRAEVYDLGLRLQRVADAEPPPAIEVVHAPTGRTFSYRDYHARLGDLFETLGGLYVQRWDEGELEDGELPPFTGEESRFFIDGSGKEVVLERAGDQTPTRLSELEAQGLLRSPFQIGNYLEALDAYLAAFALRIEGRARADFYTVSPFRNVNRPFWPWEDYDPLVYWAVRVTKNYALTPQRPGDAAYMPVLEKRLATLSARLETITAEVGAYREAFGKARAAAEARESAETY